jgi:hypothetical protein
VGVVPTMSYPQQLILSSPSVSDKDEHSATNDSSPITCRTAPLSPGNVNDDTLHSSSHDQDDASSTSFFPDKENHYALQITPSGEVKQISPSGKSSRSRLGLASESPFVHASASQSEKGQPSFQSAMADDFFPIHIACLFRAAPEVIELLIKCYPEGLEKKNKWGMLPIHIVCSNLCLEPPSITAGKLAENFSTKDFLNNLYSESMDHSDKWEMVKVVEMLVASCPQSVNMPSDNIEWYTPSEYATRNLPRNDGTTEQIMNILKKKNKMSVAGISCDGHSISSSLSDSKASSDIKAFSISNCPLLYSYISTKQWERSNDRVVKTPAEASYWVVDTAYPRLPIHLMCLNADAPQELAQALVDAYPEGCMAKEGSGSNPLHLACKNGLPLEIITTLLEKYPKATRMKDEMGRLPLHLACAVGADLAVIKALMDAYPASCSMKDYNGHTALTYVDYCMDDDSVKDEFTALFELYEDKLKRREKVGDPKTIVEEEEGDGDGDYRQLQVE